MCVAYASRAKNENRLFSLCLAYLYSSRSEAGRLRLEQTGKEKIERSAFWTTVELHRERRGRCETQRLHRAVIYVGGGSCKRANLFSLHESLSVFVVLRDTDSKAPSILATMSKQHCRSLQSERSFRQCRLYCFDIVAVFGNTVAGFGNNVRTKFRPFNNVETN